MTVRIKPQTFDEYLAAVSSEQRTALEVVRKAIHAAAPGAEEYLGYGLAAFRLNGKPLVALGAGANHCAFYPMSGKTVEAHQELLSKYETSKGAIRFRAAKPLPATLVRKLVKARIAENEELSSKAKPKTRVAKTKVDAIRTDPEVDAWLKTLRHPRKDELETLRQLILAVSPTIQEGFKWSSPSFRTTDYFATINVSGKDYLRLILHAGAKTKNLVLQIADPDGLLQWLGKERALVTIRDAVDLRAKRKALAVIVRQWIGQV